MIRSAAFWALFLLQYSSDWGWYFLQTGVPKFMNQVLGYNISSTGVLAALPYMARTLGFALFGLLADYVQKRGFMSVVCMRKTFCVICK